MIGVIHLAKCGKQTFEKGNGSGYGIGSGLGSGGWEGFGVTDSNIQQNYSSIDGYRESIASALGGRVENGYIVVDGNVVALDDELVTSIGKNMPYYTDFDIESFNKLSIDKQNGIKKGLKKSSSDLLNTVQTDYAKYKLVDAVADKLSFDIPPFEPPRAKEHGGYGMTKVIKQYETFEKDIIKLGLGILINEYSIGKTKAEIKNIKAQYKYETKSSLNDNLGKMDIVPTSNWFKNDVYFEGNKQFFVDALMEEIEKK